MKELLAALVKACGDILSAFIYVIGMKWVVADKALSSPSDTAWNNFLYWWYSLRFYRGDEIVHQAIGSRLLATL